MAHDGWYKETMYLTPTSKWHSSLACSMLHTQATSMGLPADTISEEKVHGVKYTPFWSPGLLFRFPRLRRFIHNTHASCGPGRIQVEAFLLTCSADRFEEGVGLLAEHGALQNNKECS